MTNSLKYAEINERILNFEEGDETLFDYQLNEWSYWALFRFQVFRLLLTSNENLRSATKKRLPLFMLYTLPVDFLKFPLFFCSKKHDFALGYSSNYREQDSNSGLLRDIFFDDIQENLINPIKVETYVSQYPLFGKKWNPFMFTSIIDISAKLGAPLCRVNRNSIKAFVRLVNRGLGEDLLDTGKVRHTLQQFNLKKLIYKEMFKRLDAQRLILTTAYCRFSAVAAAREQGMEVIELQHGYLSEHHAGYSWSGKVRQYKHTIPLPTKICTYGEFWSKKLRRRGFWTDEVVSVGSTRMDRFRKQQRNLAKKLFDKPVILITPDSRRQNQLAEFLMEAFSGWEKAKRFKIVIKIHPGDEDTFFFEKLKTVADIVVIKPQSKHSTFDLINDCLLHLSIQSTCHFEALALKKPTVALCCGGLGEIMQELEGTEGLQIAKTPIQLREILSTAATKKVPDSVASLFFRKNSHGMFAKILKMQT